MITALVLLAILILALGALSVRHTKQIAQMCVEFERTFPGKCMICSYHAYGRREGFTTEPTPDHFCVERFNLAKRQ